MASVTNIRLPWIDRVAFFSVNGKRFGDAIPCRCRIAGTSFEVDREIESAPAPDGGYLHLEFFKPDDQSSPFATTDYGKIVGGDSLHLNPHILDI